ncbi:MAG: tellurite resistance/C4-dicarboxylate transporter family protein, partial [Micrococcaceae bacterium]|nr:tellurite resistance/C4-dicarboxylate transporter family protein [Micrococcaceae bacterium]
MPAAPLTSPRPPTPGTTPAGLRRRFAATISDLPPSCFAFVMATGIVSAALLKSGRPVPAEILFWVAITALVILIAATLWRAIAHPGKFAADIISPAKTFGFFSFVAGLDVLGLHYVMTDRADIALVLGCLAALAWLVLTYLIPGVLLLRPQGTPVLNAANGSWFLWVVATQSLASAAAGVASAHSSNGLATLAAALWGVGVMLYMLIGTLITLRLITRANRPADLSPTYWIFMGATAISVLAGSALLKLPDSFEAIAATRGFISGTSFILWSLGLWWVPLLILFGIWRHVVHHHNMRYETALWSIVFPLGMLATSSMMFGQGQGIGIIDRIGHVTVWVAVPAWSIAVILMVVAAARWLRTPPGEPTPP